MSTEPQIAPYGGFITKSLEDETKNLEDLQNHQYEIITSLGISEIIRPEAIKIIGVDSLSTDNIENYVNYYINYNIVDDDEPDLITGELTGGKKYQLKEAEDVVEFKVEWINDSQVNIVFKNLNDSVRVLRELREKEIHGEFDVQGLGEGQEGKSRRNEEYLQECIIETPAKPYNPVIEFQQYQKEQLQARLHGNINQAKEQDTTINGEVDTGNMEEDESSIELLIRQSFQLDRKVKNAREYSRYYLIHGEPERAKRRYNQGGNRSYRERDSYRPRKHDKDEEEEEEEDLFAEKLGRSKDNSYRKNHNNDDEEEDDLFAEKLRQRDRSPTRG